MKAKQILAILIVMLLVAGTAGVALAKPDTQTWNLRNNHVMYKELSVPSATVSIGTSSSYRWNADEYATEDVGFPAGNWTGQVTLESALASGQSFTVEIGCWDGNSFISADSQPITGTGDLTYPILINASYFAVLADEYLAFQISNPNTAIVVVTGGDSSTSYVTSPSTDPGYPIPELPTIVLLATGLVCLAGYFGLKRRKRAYVRA